MSERHFEEWTLNGFKQDLCCTQEKRGEWTNKKTMILTVCETGPRATELSFFFLSKRMKAKQPQTEPIIEL